MLRSMSCCWVVPCKVTVNQRNADRNSQLSHYIDPDPQLLNPAPQGIFLGGSNPVPMMDPAMAVGKGSATGTYTVYALLVPTSGKGSRAVVGSFQYRVSKRTFSYQGRYGTTAPTRVLTVSTVAVVSATGPQETCMPLGSRKTSAARGAMHTSGP